MVTIYNTTLSATSQRHFSDGLGVGFVQMRWQEVKHNFAAQNRKKRFSPLRKESLFIIT